MLRLYLNLLLPLIVLTVGGCDNENVNNPRLEAPLVKVTRVVESGDLTHSFSGVIAPRVQSDLGFRVSGKVHERLVDTGQVVKLGQVLLILDRSDLLLQLKAQEQTLKAAKAREKQVLADLARYKTLLGSGVVAVSAYEQIKAQADTATAELKSATAQVDLARNALNYTTLKADSDGVIVETLVEPGQVVAAGQTVIRIARAGQREALVDLPETIRPSIGDVADATLYGKENAVIKARLRQISSAADPATRTFQARFVLDDSALQAPLGSTVTLRLREGNNSENIFQVPIGALFNMGAGSSTGVWIISERDKKVSWHPVKLVNITSDVANVVGDISDGMIVVSQGANLLHEGEVVRTVNNNFDISIRI